MEETNALSRRQWLVSMAVPALAGASSMIGFEAKGSPRDQGKEDNLAGARIYNVRDFGAKGDGKTLNTKAIQAAIDKCFMIMVERC